MTEFTLLCVDDEPNILKSLKRLFRSQPFQVVTACNGREGLTILAHTPIQVVLSDLRMPEMDGVEFLQQVTNHFPETRFILLTGSESAVSLRNSSDECKPAAVFTKPWDDQLLLSYIQACFERAGLKGCAA